jgi:hypothetical protein
MHEQERERADAVEAARRHGAPKGAGDMAWESARRVVATGQKQAMAPPAVLRLQRLAGNAGVSSLVEEERSPVLDIVGKGGGAPLPTDVRTHMERGLGADFGDVRVHDGGPAAASAQAVQAKAYTVGNDVVFNDGAYQPHTDAGQRTLAHELTHVVQQRSGPVDGTPTGDGVAVSHPTDRFEREAEAAATAFASPAGFAGGPTEAATAGRTAQTVQREESTEDEEPVQEMPLQREDEAKDEDEEPVQEMPLQREEQGAVPDDEDLTAE